MSEKYELRVGFFTLIALILLLYGWGWLKSFSPFDPPMIFWVRFHDVAGLSNNATVNIQGVRVGTVDKISFQKPDDLQEEPEANKADNKLPRVYAKVRITGAKMSIPKSASITIQTLGMVGAKYIEITLPQEASEQDADPIDPNIVMRGNDPVRVELVINNIARKVNRAADALSSEEADHALKDIAQAASKLNKTMDRMPDVTTSIKKASDNIGRTAEKTETLAGDADRFFNDGRSSINSFDSLAQGLSKTNTKFSKMLDNPAFSSDLKETAEMAHKAAQSISSAMAELNETVKDKDLRHDLIEMLSKLQVSANDIRHSVGIVNNMANDSGLRNDIKDTVHEAKETLEKTNQMLADPAFRQDIQQTLSRVRNTADDVDAAAKQLHQILGKRAPLFQMMFGRPGTLPPEKVKEVLREASPSDLPAPTK